MQLKAFIATPHAPGWAQLATAVAYYPLQMRAAQKTVDATEMQAAFNSWRSGAALPAIPGQENGKWVYNEQACLNQDIVTYITVDDAFSNRQSQVIVLARLGDSDAETAGSDFKERWRRFLACLNMYQFTENFRCWVSSQVEDDTAPEIPLEAAEAVSGDWQPVLANVTPSLRPYVQELAAAGLTVPTGIPRVEFFNERIDDDAFAELAWPDCSPPVALLAGDQTDFAAEWQRQGWKVVTPDDLQAKGIVHLIDLLVKGIPGA